MPDRSVYSWSNIGVSLAGGLAAAAVFALLTKGSFSGQLLAHLAPLPIMIVALGFGVRHGLTSALVATAALTVWPNPMFGLAYALLVAFPAWLAAFAASGAPWGRRGDLLRRHLPAWAILAAAAVLASVVSFWLAAAALVHGGLDEALNPIRARAFMVLDDMMRTRELGGKFNAEQLSGVVARSIPAFGAAYFLLMHTLNLWVAARLTQLSAPTPSKWPDIVTEFVLPRAVAALFAAGFGLSFVGGVAGPIGLVIAVTFGLVLAFQGLAVAHGLLRGSKSSWFVLSILYFMIGLMVWPIVLLTALGFAEAVFDYRSRRKAGAGAPPPD